MSSDSTTLRLGDAVEVTDYVANGSFASLKKNVEYRSGAGYAILARLVDHNSQWKNEKVYVGEEAYRFLSKSALVPGDVVIANVGANAGTVFRIPDLGAPVTLGPNAVRVRPKDQRIVDQDFLYYYLTSPVGQARLQDLITGSAQPKFNKTALRGMAIRVPPIHEQRRIAGISKSLDDRIALLRQTNSTLEAIAQALFKSWFVDFGPVRAKMEGRMPEGMDEATAALFPSELQQSELGPIPSSWSAQTFRSTVDVLGGGTPKTSVSEYWGGTIPWYSVVDAPRATDIFVIETEKHITEAALHGSSTRLLPAGTTIISARGTVGRLALTASPMAMNQSCYGLRGVAADVYFTYFSTTRLVDKLKQHAHGSVFDTITQDTLQSIKTVYPEPTIVAAFDSAVAPLMQRVEANLQLSRTLAELRDTVLPRLISGQLHIEQAAEVLEPA